jgi:hypothetical protein
MSFLSKFFGGGSKKSSKSGSSSKDKSSIQKQINAEQARIGKGNWNQKLNDLVKQRDNPSSGGGIAALKNAPKNIARDIGMGVGLTKRDADYYRRTANTIARTQGTAAADRYIKQMTAKGGDAAAGVKNADVSGSVNYGQRIGMLNADGSVNTKYMNSDDGGIASLKNANTEADDMTDQYAENLRRYEEYMKSQQPQGPAVTPDMRRAALDVFESQRGAGQMPYYMAAAQGATSPAFQYAAQNYATLGGSQRLAPRPMEMMSVAERGQINDMAQAMADQEAARRAAETDYQAGMDMVMRGGMGKGGPKTAPQQGGQFNSMEELMEFQNQNPSMNLMGEYQRLKALEGGGQPTQMPRFGGKGRGGFAPQLPPGMVGLPRTPDYGGGSPNPIQRSPFASILASRFGGFGG